MVPIVVFDQIYSFDVDALIKSIPRPEKVTAKDSSRGRGVVPSDHADGGQRGCDGRAPRAELSRLRYPAIYATAAEAFGRTAR